jgi:hypothetical protein
VLWDAILELPETRQRRVRPPGRRHWHGPGVGFFDIVKRFQYRRERGPRAWACGR